MAQGLDGKRILIVEDEYFIASDLARAFKGENAVVVGPVASVAAGMSLMEQGRVDAAVLDVNLLGDRSYALADRLTSKSVPHVFVTGYDEWSLPEAYRDTPRLAKPFTTGSLISMVERLCAESVA